jgi:hypothetical protein
LHDAEGVTIARRVGKTQCRTHIENAEKKHDIPHKLLEAVATAESGISPWVVNYQGRARFFSSKEEAAKHIRDLHKKGIKNINIGCMQLHAPSHLKRFSSLEDMLEPENNIAYAAKLLGQLKRKHGSIEKAIKYYHSTSSAYNEPYKNKILRIWKKLQNQSSTSQKVIQTSASSPKTKKKHNVKLGFGPAAGKKKEK